MLPGILTIPERKETLDRFVENRVQHGFQIISRSPLTTELYKPRPLPVWFVKSQSLFADVDEFGRVWVMKYIHED